MKFLYVYVFIALFALVSANSTASHNLILGSRLPGDRHLIREVVFKKSGFMRKKSGDYSFDQKVCAGVHVGKTNNDRNAVISSL